MENGTRFRAQTVAEHFASTYHKECRQAQILKNQEIGKKNTNKSLIDMHISEANKMYANHIGKLMLQVYTDAKRLTVSAHSWPARFIASECGLIFDFNSVRESTVPENINIQYVNPPGHLKLLTTIVNSWDEIQSKIQNSLAFSIHVDGSVDKSQIDKIYILLKIVNTNGHLETLFLGIGEKVARGHQGLFDAVIKGMIDNVGSEVYEMIMANAWGYVIESRPLIS